MPLTTNSSNCVKEQTDIFGLPSTVNDKVVNITKNAWINAKKAPKKPSNGEYGTFKDSLRAPIHRWFKYPAGYSYKLIEEKINQYNLSSKHWIIDPFVGSGTTVVEAKRQGINSIGLEAHPFVHWVAKQKIKWNLPLQDLVDSYSEVLRISNKNFKHINIEGIPELVHKCYSPSNLKCLASIKSAIDSLELKNGVKDILKLSLVDTLRNASKAATGWPYIAPNKMHEKAIEKDAFEEFGIQTKKMYDDLEFIKTNYFNPKTITKIYLWDSRKKHNSIAYKSVDLAITSPPYLNNYDYADRTRLETYFMGWYKTWGEITKKVRDKLIIAATTQIRRNDFTENYGLSDEIKSANKELYNFLLSKVEELALLRNQKGGKKSYDLMVARYFSDIFQVLKQVYKYLKSNRDFVLVLGDSAPYGIYIPTHEVIAELGKSIGFHSSSFEELRKRGDKWRDNPQRHNVKLKEVILTLKKK